MNVKNAIALMAISASVIGIAKAEKPGAYVGGGLGYSSLGNFTETTKKDNGGLGGVLFTGYKFNQYFGVEAGYRKYAATNYILDNAPSVTLNYTMYAFTLVGKGYLPLGKDNNPFNLYISLGAAEVYGNAKANAFGYSKVSSSNNSLLVTTALGVSYAINSHFISSLEYSGTQGKNGDSKHVGIPYSAMANLNIAYNL